MQRISPPADVIRRIRAEYLEMPGLRLTAIQARRLFGLTATTCDMVLDDLLKCGFLWRTSQGRFALAEGIDFAAPHGRLGNSKYRGM